MYRLLIIAAFVVAAAAAGEDLDLNTLTSNFSQSLNLTSSEEQVAEELGNALREKCLAESGSETAYENIKKAPDALKLCLRSLINIQEIEQEVEAAKPTGDLDEVFKKYCDKRTLMQQCLINFADTFDPCLTAEGKNSKRVVLNVTESLGTFVCHKDGDRIALFIAEEGLECLESKKTQMADCLSDAMPDNLSDELPPTDSLTQLLFDAKQCDDLSKLSSCIVRELEGCSQPTPANIVEALFRFVRNMTPCKVPSN